VRLSVRAGSTVAVLLLGGAVGAIATATASDAAQRPEFVSHQDTTEFRHRDHRGVSCVTCHPSEETHGDLTVTRREDCLQCHHRAADAPACTRCHASEGLLRSTYPVRRSLELSVGPTSERALSFGHGDHEDIACGDCHTEGPELSAGRVSCADCHEEHHRLTSDCIACHTEAPEGAHPIEVAHVTCGGSGCHASLPFPRVPRSRPACLACHQGLGDHRPDRPCVECHVLPDREPVRSAAGEGGRP
jgi:hypothetical protein